MANKAITFNVFQGINGKWYWNIRHGNNKIIADSAQGYTQRSGCVRAARTIRSALQGPCAVTIDETPNPVFMRGKVARVRDRV